MRSVLLVFLLFLLSINVQTEQDARCEVRVRAEVDREESTLQRMREEHEEQMLYLGKIAWLLYEEQQGACFDTLTKNPRPFFIREH